MTKSWWGRLVSLGLVVVFPYSMMASEMRAAVVNASESVVVNGKQVPKTTTVLPGDRVTIPATSDATMTLNGTSIVIPRASTVTFGGDSVSLDHQAAVWVNTTQGVAAEVKGIRIAPAANGTAQYQVARFNGQVFIAAKQGNVTLDDSTGSHVVPEGKMLAVADPEPQKPGSVPATTGAGVSAGAIPTWVAVLIGLAAAGAAAAVGIATTGRPTSPAHP